MFTINIQLIFKTIMVHLDIPEDMMETGSPADFFCELFSSSLISRSDLLLQLNEFFGELLKI